MVMFWDTSAIVPMLTVETTSHAIASLLATDPGVIAWWGTPVECVSALARLERQALVTREESAAAFARLEAASSSWQEIEPGERVRQIAMRLVRTHPLRGADAFQLAAAIVAADGEPRSLPFVTLDPRLALAASREGFPVLEPN